MTDPTASTADMAEGIEKLSLTDLEVTKATATRTMGQVEGHTTDMTITKTETRNITGMSTTGRAIIGTRHVTGMNTIRQGTTGTMTTAHVNTTDPATKGTNTTHGSTTDPTITAAQTSERQPTQKKTTKLKARDKVDTMPASMDGEEDSERIVFKGRKGTTPGKGQQTAPSHRYNLRSKAGTKTQPSKGTAKLNPPTHPSLSAGAPAFAPSFAPINAPPPQRMPLQYPQAQTFSRAINPAFFAQNVPPSPYPAWMPSRHEPLSKWQAPSGPAPSQSQSELPFRSSPIPPPPPRSPHQDPIKFLIKRPEPTSAYRTQAALDPQTLDKPHRLLIVLDLNGTLLFRKRAGSTFVARPRVHDFLRYLIAHHEVLIWSSARQQNVTNIVDNLFTKEQKPKLVGVWARDKLRLSAEHYNQRVQVYKQLSWIWNDPLIIAESCAEGYHWSQANSVMIDDSLEKAASEPYNLIRIDEFEGKEEQKKVDVLGQVVKYLEKLRWQQDVSAYMRSSPFVFDTAAEAYDWSEIV